MAPELRKRKATPASPATPKAATVKSKRKADDESPLVVIKKAKASPETEVKEKSTSKIKKPTKAPEPIAALAEEPTDIEEDATATDITIQDEDVEQEVDAELRALAADLDPENETFKTVSTFAPGQDIGTIPVPKGKKKAGGAKEQPGVVYIGRVPHGFYENEIKQYFSQFGPILRLRMSRNKRTGASKHFAFVEFAEASTAEIVAKTMDNYLLFGHILKCKVVANEKLHADIWKGANKRFKKIPYNKMEGLILYKPKSESTWAKKIARENEKRAEKAKKMKALGYHFKPTVVKEAPTPVAIENVVAEKVEEEEKTPMTIEVVDGEGIDSEVKEAAIVEKEAAPKKTKSLGKVKASPKVLAKPTRSSTRNKKAVA